MSWPDFDATVTFVLEDDANPELCEEFWSGLPFSCIQEHGMVTGDLIYCWTPLVSVAPVRVYNLHNESPMGRVSYSQVTGNKVIVKYGPLSEDLPAPVLGLVDGQHHKTLIDIGNAVWRNTMTSKRLLRVSFESAGVRT
jgi:hypothetical protein